MIFLRAYRVLYSPNKTKTLVPIKTKTRLSWPNEYYDKFNTFEAKAWRKYLAEEFKLPNGNKLDHYLMLNFLF